MTRHERDSVEIVSALLLPTLLVALCLVLAGVTNSLLGMAADQSEAVRAVVLAVACPVALALTFYRLWRSTAGSRSRE